MSLTSRLIFSPISRSVADKVMVLSSFPDNMRFCNTGLAERSGTTVVTRDNASEKTDLFMENSIYNTLTKKGEMDVDQDNYWGTIINAPAAKVKFFLSPSGAAAALFDQLLL